MNEARGSWAMGLELFSAAGVVALFTPDREPGAAFASMAARCGEQRAANAGLRPAPDAVRRSMVLPLSQSTGVRCA